LAGRWVGSVAANELGRLYGEDDNDTLLGGDGNDLLLGGKGNDVIGSGATRPAWPARSANPQQNTLP